MIQDPNEVELDQMSPPAILFRPADPVLIPSHDEILGTDPGAFLAKFTDIAANNLACAVGLPGTEELDVLKLLARLDEMAAFARRWTEKSWRLFDLKPAEFNHSKNAFRVLTMTHVIFRHFGVRYNPERLKPNGETDLEKLDDGDSQDLFIHGALGPRKTGICGTLPVLAVAVGRRLGYPLYLVKIPDHLLFRWHDQEERFNVECTTAQGACLHPDEFYREWPKKYLPEMWAQRHASGYRWLDSMSPRIEMARFISNRIIVLRQHHRFDEALMWISVLEKFHDIEYGNWKIDTLARKALVKAREKDSDLANRPLSAQDKCSSAEVADVIRWIANPTISPLNSSPMRSTVATPFVSRHLQRIMKIATNPDLVKEKGKSE